ncbi:MAG: RNase P subunit p30 family protein [Candidatus Bathyarchaeia archaeon]
MRKRFADLHVLVPPSELAASTSWIRDLGIRVLAFTPGRQDKSEDISRALASLEAEGVEAHLRLDVDPAQGGKLLRKIAALRAEFQLIAGAITSAQGLRLLLRSGVDTLFADVSHSRFLGPRSFESIAQAGKPFEVNIRPVIVTRGVQRAHALQELSRQVALAADAGATIILSSGALNLWEMRPPREMANILALLSFDQGTAIETVSSSPLRLLREPCQSRRRNG